MKCIKCGGEMMPGKCIEQTWRWHHDFPGDQLGQRGQTMSPSGPGKLADCLKCVECGWSVS